MPMTPAPMMHSFLGSVLSCSNWVLVITRGSLMSGMGQQLGLAARGNDDVSGGDGGAAHADGVGIEETGLAPQQGDIGVGEQRLYALAQLLHHLLLALECLRERGRVDIGLRGYAATVQTGAAHLVALNEHRFQTVPGGQLGSAIAARTRSNN